MAEKVEFLLLDIDYVLENDKPIIRMWGRTHDGRTVLANDRNFRPYFYIEIDESAGFDMNIFRGKLAALQDFANKINGVEIVEKNLLGETKRFVKIVLQEPGDVNNLRRIVEGWTEAKKPFEYDIPFYRRYLIDKDLTPCNWVAAEGTARKGGEAAETIEVAGITPSKGENPKFQTMALDIEVYGDEVIMVSLVGPGYRKALTYGWKGAKHENTEILAGEKEMLEELVKIVQEKDPDVIVTYNGDLFDFVKLRERANLHKVSLNFGRDGSHMEFVKRGRLFPASIPGRVHIDVYNFIANVLADTMESETLTLDMVSKELLGYGKEPLDWKQMEDVWKEKKDLATIADYCLRDSELTFKLSDRLLPQIFELSKIVGQTPFDTSRMTYSQLVEWLLIRKAKERGEIALNRPDMKEIEHRREATPYEGGYVLMPEPGIHENIALFDFASLYPTTIITHNISPETLDKNGDGKRNAVPGSEHYFSLSKKGFIPSIIEELVRKRAAIKKEMETAQPGSQKYKDLYSRQYALKILANASYGYYAYAGSRWYSRICAMSIAAFGRHYIQKVISYAKTKGFNVIYGDTDSLFIADCSEAGANRILREINETLPGVMEMDLEGIYKAGIFVPAKTGMTAKKRYALLDENGRITIRGLEKVRRDWCSIAKDTQESVLMAILRDRDAKKAVSLVQEVINRINTGDIDPKDLVIYTQLTKPIEEYEQIGPHVAAAKKYAARGQPVKEGSVIGYVITKGEGSISNRAEPFEYAQNYDPDYYINNQILPAAMRILNAVGFTEDDVLSPSAKSQSSLDAFVRKPRKKSGHPTGKGKITRSKNA